MTGWRRYQETLNLLAHPQAAQSPNLTFALLGVLESHSTLGVPATAAPTLTKPLTVATPLLLHYCTPSAPSPAVRARRISHRTDTTKGGPLRPLPSHTAALDTLSLEPALHPLYLVPVACDWAFPFRFTATPANGQQ